jgi:hypothetical protein
MRDHAKLRACELADEVHPDSVHAQQRTAFNLQPTRLSSFGSTRSPRTDCQGMRETLP